MLGALITGIVIISVVIVTRNSLKKQQEYRRDYSLGLRAAKEVQKLIKKKRYLEAEEKVKEQSLNDVTQIIDHLSLSLKKNELLSWNESRESDLSKLTLGVFYLHMAWITRGHQRAKNVSNEQFEGFFEYLNLCKEMFETISIKSFYNPEVESRRIRLYMSLEDYSLATECFTSLSKNYPDFIWPFIHYCELIQPKWGGEIENVEKLYESLPDDFLIRSIVELKLINDSIVMNDNYFRKYNDDIYEYARERVINIDAEYNTNEVNSIHRYILFNYMEGVSDDAGVKKLKKKYEKLMDGNFTIYPYGLLTH